MKLKSLLILSILVSGTLIGIGPFIQKSLGQVSDENTIDIISEERLDILFNILKNASIHVQQRLDDLQDKGVIIPEKALEKAGNGLLLAHDAILKRELGNIQGAMEDVFAAMDNFKESIRETEEFVKNSLKEDDVNQTEDTLSITSKLERIKDLRDKLEDIAEKKIEHGHNASGIWVAISNANNRIDRIEKQLDEGIVNVSNSEINDIANELGSLQDNELEDLAKKDKPNKTEKFIESAINRIDELKKQFNNLPIPENVRISIIESLDNSLLKIIESQNLIKSGYVSESIDSLEDSVFEENDALKEVEDHVPDIGVGLKSIEELKKVIDRLEVKLNRYEKSNNNLGNAQIISEIKIKISEARSILRNASLTLQENPSDANQLKKQAETLKDIIENNIDQLEHVIEEHDNKDEKNNRNNKND